MPDTEWVAAKTAHALTLHELTQARLEGVSAEDIEGFRLRHRLARKHLSELQSVRMKPRPESPNVVPPENQ